MDLTINRRNKRLLNLTQSRLLSNLYILWYNKIRNRTQI